MVKFLINRAALIVIAAMILCAVPIFGTILNNDPSVKHGDAPNGEGWSAIESNHFTIYYRSDANLKYIDRKLKKRSFYFAQKPEGDTPSEKIGYRLDYLFNRVGDILGMKPDMKKVKVKIFEDSGDLEDEYFKIFRTKSEVKAFYVHKYETIYTCESDINDSVMVHEIAHAIIDHYFSSIPPAKASEVLASYVDMHLEDE